MGAPDSQCCCLGVGAIVPEALSNMSGSSTCLNSTVTDPVADLRVTNYSHVVPGLWSAEVGLNTTGAALKWLTALLLPDLAPGQRYAAVGKMAARARPSGVTFLPYLMDGERDSQAVKGGFHNLSMATTSADLLRAVLEGVAFAERRRIDLLIGAGCPLTTMFISGGGARLDLWNQIKADATGLPVQAVTDVDATELGAAMLAGIGVGVYKDASEAVSVCQRTAREFTPNKRHTLEYEERYRAFTDLERLLAGDGASGS